MKIANNERRKITEVKRNDQQIYVTEEESKHTKIYDVTINKKGDNQIISCAMNIKGRESATNKVKFIFDDGDIFEYNVIAKHQIICFPTQKELSKEEADHYLKYLAGRDLNSLAYFTYRAFKKLNLVETLEEKEKYLWRVDKIEINSENYDLTDFKKDLMGIFDKLENFEQGIIYIEEKIV